MSVYLCVSLPVYLPVHVTCVCRQQLCPSLIQIVANPVVDKSLSVRSIVVNDDVGRGSGCSAAPPNIPGCSAKAIYGSVPFTHTSPFHDATDYCSNFST